MSESLKLEILDPEGQDDFAVTFETAPAIDAKDLIECSRYKAQREVVRDAEMKLDAEIEEREKKIAALNAQIDKLTNHADGVDYAAAVICGLITGIIDSVFVGAWDFKKAKDTANQDINNKVTDFAKKDPQFVPWCNKNGKDPNRLASAIQYLEQKYKLPGDGDYQNNLFAKAAGVTNKTHHLDDFCHHPTLIGLVCCVLVQFTGETKYAGAKGVTEAIPVQVNEYGNFVSKNTWGKVFAGIINWFFTVAKTIANRKGHLMSDMAGSLSSATKGNQGAGIPGSFLSTLKELSALPILKDTNFAKNLRKAYQNGIGAGNGQIDLGPFNALFAGASSKFDMRTEMAIMSELKRQAMPVILNEILVRAFYFVRRLIQEMKIKESLSEIEWGKCIPFGNRTVERMMLIASGTFTAVDLADAAIRAGLNESSVNPVAFASNMLLRVNFVGVGRLVVAIGVDVGMGIRKEHLRNERIKVMNEQLALLNAKVFYTQAEFNYAMAEALDTQVTMWETASDTIEALNNAYEVAKTSVVLFRENLNDIKRAWKKLSTLRPGIVENNPDTLKKSILILREI